MRIGKLLASEKGQILRHVIVVGIVIAIVIFAMTQIGPPIFERFSVAQTAEDIADAAANQYRAYHDEFQVVQECTDKLRLAAYTDEEISQCEILFLPAGAQSKTSVRVTVIKFVDTMLTRNVKAFKKFSRITCSNEAPIVESNR
ncbi:MAG: hypothetical protein CVT63_01955 [Candidatus Anoxymicrobium japonicum]|uniref:Uncharacterized protein n=1 Tax=Candidatus Anoxymicrobium japonicum TaxID=2013648 RepID=A0A2N3G7H5_9ACTN|nr:MAG: hypothetical protein CVT63_01955 [Candidatus Anoxymicrobium japonicum]